MTSLWRISEFRDLSGEGGRIASARWHTRGRPVVYLAETPAGAMLERIVHLLDRDEGGILPRTYQLLRISVPDEAAIKPLSTLASLGRPVGGPGGLGVGFGGQFGSPPPRPSFLLLFPSGYFLLPTPQPPATAVENTKCNR